MLIIGLIIILLGIAIILDEIFHTSLWSYISMYWPIIFIFLGISELNKKDESKTDAFILILIGLVIQIYKLKILKFRLFPVIFAIILIIVGIDKVINALNNKDREKRKIFTINMDDDKKRVKIYDQDILDENISFTSKDLKVKSNSFSGGKLNIKFSRVTLDLSQVKSISKDINLNIKLRFANLELILPKTWHIIVNDKHYYSDNENSVDTILNINTNEKFSDFKYYKKRLT